jgi:hypothetical protein
MASTTATTPEGLLAQRELNAKLEKERFGVSVEPRVVCVGSRRLPVEIGGK